jgi:hypothetical protein
LFVSQFICIFFLSVCFKVFISVLSSFCLFQS